MKLYAIRYTDAEGAPQTFWTASIAEAGKWTTELPEAERPQAAIRIVELPRNRAAMARWFNEAKVGGWQ